MPNEREEAIVTEPSHNETAASAVAQQQSRTRPQQSEPSSERQAPSSSPSSSPQLPEVGESGLSLEKVAELVAAGAVNHLDQRTSRSYKDIIRSNVFTLFNGIIFVAMLVVLIAGQWRDAVFGMVIIVNTGIGIFTELRAKRALDSLSILIASRSMVRRAGENVEVAHEDIVLGDLLWIRSGEQVPADAEMVESWGLELDESMLTGESRTVRKRSGNAVFSGSTAVSGLGLARVSAVGASSYAATLTDKAKVYKKIHSDLQDGINKILKYMTYVVVPLCVFLVWSQIHAVDGFRAAFATGEWRTAVVSAVAGVVGMIPEGLVLLTSLNFALSAIRLARKNTLIQQLESVETLARVDCLNLDKTGTITDGGIAFDGLIALSGTQRSLEQAAFDVLNEETPNATGASVIAALRKSGYAGTSVDKRIPFSSARKWSAARLADSSTWYCGAPEILLSALPAPYPEVRSLVSEYAKKGNRVLLLARGRYAQRSDFTSEVLPGDLEPAAIIACSESIRPDAAETLRYFREQGVRCRIISGDNPETVGAIAAKVALMGEEVAPRALDARELPKDPVALAAALENIDVLGRVLPEQKKAIVDALHLKSHVVAMTGDGVNDSLAIKEADLGIAMGNAASATKSVAQVVLVDSKFSHLPDVVSQGRRVMANMERVASLFLVKTCYSALISLGVVLAAVPFPYLPRHMTYISALTIGIPAFILSLAPNNQRYRKGFLARVVLFSLPSGVAIGACVLAVSLLLPGYAGWNIFDNPHELTVLRTCSAIVVFTLGVAVLARVSKPLASWRGGLVFGVAAAGVAGAFIPAVARFFAIDLPDDIAGLHLLVALGASVLAFVVVQEIVRWAVRWMRRRFISSPHEIRRR